MKYAVLLKGVNPAYRGKRYSRYGWALVAVRREISRKCSGLGWVKVVS